MYLSRLILNPRHRRVQSEIARPYEMHRTVLRAFPDNLDRLAERVLYRLDVQPRTGELHLLVQSVIPPDWSWLASPEMRGYLLPVDVPNPAIKPFDVQLGTGQVLLFRLLANPTVKRQGKRYGLYRENEQRQWLAQKGLRGGFQVLSARVSNHTTIEDRVYHGEVSHTLQFLAVQFDGLLRVSDPTILRQTVQQGIGSGKGFGFGLLSLALPPG